MLDTIKKEIEQAEQSESFAEFYQFYIQDIQDKIIEQEVQHVTNLISSPDDRLVVNSQIDFLTKELIR